MINLELQIQNYQVNNNIQEVNGNMTLNDVERTIPKNNFIFDRGDIPISKLNNTLFQIKEEFFPNSNLKFYLLRDSDKLIKSLAESEINFKNIDFSSCAESCFLQSLVHIIFPEAIKNLNNEREKRFKPKVKDLNELKNNNLLNNVVINTLKEILYIQGCGNGGLGKDGKKTYEAKNYHRIRGGGPGQPLSKEIDIKNDFQAVCDQAVSPEAAIDIARTALKNFLNSNHSNPPKKLMKEELMKIHKIFNNTIISNLVKIKIEGDFNFVSNLVLKIKDKNLIQSYTNIYNLIDDCPQLNNGYSKKKITHLSQVIFMIVDRISTYKEIRDNFDVNETIYFDSLNGRFSQFPSNSYGFITYELKFTIYHLSFGHFVAYSKIRGEWYYFDDLSGDYAKKSIPPLHVINNKDSCSVCFYYVKQN